VRGARSEIAHDALLSAVVAIAVFLQEGTCGEAYGGLRPPLVTTGLWFLEFALAVTTPVYEAAETSPSCIRHGVSDGMFTVALTLGVVLHRTAPARLGNPAVRRETTEDCAQVSVGVFSVDVSADAAVCCLP
jgi:hypothetical protein